MAITDYIFQEETVIKQNFGQWLVDKMVAAGWQQISSNPPSGPTDTAVNKFYMMKTTRPSDGLEAYIGINDGALRTSTNGSYNNLGINLMPDYTPGAPGTNGTSSRTLTGNGWITTNTSTTTSFSNIFKIATTVALPLDTPLSIRFVISRTNVTLIVRVPSFYNVAGCVLFFGLPDTFLDEKPSSASVVFSTLTNGATNDSPMVSDTPLGVATSSNMYEANGEVLNVFKSPDQSGRFPLFPIYIGDTNTGIRHMVPSLYAMGTGGVLDRDIIQVGGMNFEVVVTAASLTGVGNTFAYRI
ncbi:hypothetical protein KD909_15010 (plasmid) [Exiguobacterium sp. PFWT01]|uniref:hypothetical protein n=1 Tax=Exiguobacterium sp. PFWT01 TaxID=2829816 RepID=UPI001BACC170|nr:hypothetical protein [Exiguobacterium sp. PFWT01]QUP88737.1 hypothetical protein KD909_15010 [Exiguobacterium sp. PFWT01]